MRILAVDGGGVRGIVPGASLAWWESELETSLADRFDLFAGTSTGAIVAAALAIGMKAKEVETIFRDRVPQVFTREGKTFAERALSFKGWAVPAYSAESLREALTTSFGALKLSECPRPLCIPCLDVVTGTPKVFRSHHFPRSGSDDEVTLVDAILASTAAPSFFPSAQVAGSSFVDGALWANNPALLALLESADLQPGSRPFETARVLSLGCGKPFWGQDVGFGLRRGLLGWSLPLMSLMMSSQSEGVHGYLRRLVDDARYLRVDPPLPRGLIALDQPKNLPALTVRARESAREAFEDVAELLED